MWGQKQRQTTAGVASLQCALGREWGPFITPADPAGIPSSEGLMKETAPTQPLDPLSECGHLAAMFSGAFCLGERILLSSVLPCALCTVGHCSWLGTATLVYGTLSVWRGKASS